MNLNNWIEHFSALFVLHDRFFNWDYNTWLWLYRGTWHSHYETKGFEIYCMKDNNINNNFSKILVHKS
jgi:hypothetical protein